MKNQEIEKKPKPKYVRVLSILKLLLSFTSLDYPIATLFVAHKNESNKIAQTIWHCFPIQFLLLFQVMYFVLLSVLPIKTDNLRDADWLLKDLINQQKGL